MDPSHATGGENPLLSQCFRLMEVGIVKRANSTINNPANTTRFLPVSDEEIQRRHCQCGNSNKVGYEVSYTQQATYPERGWLEDLHKVLQPAEEG
jgi:hypothetical protein